MCTLCIFFGKQVIKIALLCNNNSTFAPRKLSTIIIGLKTNMKNLKISVAILVASTFVVSCSKSDVFEQSQSSVSDLKMNQYKTSFVQKYGEIAPDQSWDFSTVSNAKASTRGEGEIVETINTLVQYKQIVKNEKDEIKKYFNSKGEVKTWIPRLSVRMFAALAHNTMSKKVYLNFEICHDNTRTSVVPGVNVKNDKWYDVGTSNTMNNSGYNIRQVNTKSLSTDAYWVAYFTYGKNTGDANAAHNQNVLANLQNYKVEKYKEYTSKKGNIYWGFDCTGDGDYSDLIFLVTDIDPVRPIEKRYMVEDLGAIGDFDFNDIVFDVQQDVQGKQKCIIRAMGGTLDFTLKVGNKTWTKSDEGAKKGYQPAVMYNTNPIKKDEVLAEFDVTGWNPTDNNVSVSVVSKENNGVITVIPFPKKGEVPMIIAFDTFYEWMPEQESLPDNWWYILNDQFGEVEE